MFGAQVEQQRARGRCERGLNPVPMVAGEGKDEAARKKKKTNGDHGAKGRGEGEVKEEETWSRGVHGSRSMKNTNWPPHTYTTRNENIPASFGLLSAIKRIPPVQPRINRVPGPKQPRIRFASRFSTARRIKRSVPLQLQILTLGVSNPSTLMDSYSWWYIFSFI